MQAGDVIELPQDVFRWMRAARHVQLLFAAIDLRLVLAAGPPMAVEISQVGIFDQTRVMLYAAAFVLSAASGIAYQIATPKFTFWSCLASFLNSGLLGLSLMLVGLAFEWGASQPGLLLGFCIAVGLCGPAATKKLQESIPDIIVWFLQSAAERLAGRQRRLDEKQEKLDEKQAQLDEDVQELADEQEQKP